MQLPLQITFRDMPSSEAVETRIHEEVSKLETFYDRIIGCRVVVEIPHRRHRKGNPFHIRVDLTVPGAEIVVKHEPNVHSTAQDTEEGDVAKEYEMEAAHKDIYVAIRHVFDDVKRQLQDYVRRRHTGSAKAHQTAPHARISELFDKGFGFLETADGREVYFHQSSIVGGNFDQLTVGMEVSFVEEPGEKGPQANSVKILRPHRSKKAQPATA